MPELSEQLCLFKNLKCWCRYYRENLYTASKMKKKIKDRRNSMRWQQIKPYCHWQATTQRYDPAILRFEKVWRKTLNHSTCKKTGVRAWNLELVNNLDFLDTHHFSHTKSWSKYHRKSPRNQKIAGDKRPVENVYCQVSQIVLLCFSFAKIPACWKMNKSTKWISRMLSGISKWKFKTIIGGYEAS